MGAGRVLVVEPVGRTAASLAKALRGRSFDVSTAPTGRDGLLAATRCRPDAVVTTFELPDMSAVGFIAGLRGWSSAAIVVASSSDRELDKIDVLDAGADDVLVRPFGTGELCARLRAITRRNTRLPDAPPRIETDDFVIDLQAMQVKTPHGEVQLTPKEWAIVALLVRHRGRLVPHSVLLRDVWGEAYVQEHHYVRVYMAQIRRKLEHDAAHPRYFVTEPGLGVRFVESSAQRVVDTTRLTG